MIFIERVVVSLFHIDEFAVIACYHLNIIFFGFTPLSTHEGGFAKASVLDTRPPQRLVAALYGKEFAPDPTVLCCPGIWRPARLTYFDGNMFEGGWLDGGSEDDAVNDSMTFLF
jgi:hypothetical protein